MIRKRPAVIDNNADVELVDLVDVDELPHKAGLQGFRETIRRCVIYLSGVRTWRLPCLASLFRTLTLIGLQ